MGGRALFLAIWTPLMALTVWGLFFQKLHLDQSGKPLAQIENQVGDIQFRTEEEILWRTTEENQYVFENDNIATGDNSYASLNFGNSRIIELGPNTQIRIRPLSSSSNEFELDLVRGNIAARDRKDTGANGKLKNGGAAFLKIHAGDDTYQMKQASELGLSRGRAGAQGVVDHANGDISLAAKDGHTTAIDAKGANGPLSLLASIDSELEIVRPKVQERKPTPPAPKALPLAPPVVAPPPQAPVPPPVVATPPPPTPLEAQAQSLLPALLYPPENNILWIADSFENAATKVIPVALQPPSDVKEGEGWQPVLGAFKGTEKSPPTLMWEGTPTLRRQVIPINLAQLSDKNIVKAESGVPPERQFVLAPGVKLQKDGKSASVFGPARTIIARSCDITLKGPVKIELGRMNFKEMRQPWFVTPRDFEPGAAIFLREEVNLAKLASVLHVSRGFRWTTEEDALKGQGVYIVRNNQVIGKLSGAIGDQRTLEAIRIGIGADVIYQGSAQAYIGGLVEFKERAIKKSLPEKVYILNDGRFIAINRDFMKTNPALRRFLDENSPAFFAEPIETLAADKFLK